MRIIPGEYSRWSFPLIIGQCGGDGATANLPGGCGWNTFNEIDFLGTFEFCKKFAAVLNEFRFRGGVAFTQTHRCRHFFTEYWMRTPKRNRSCNGGRGKGNFTAF